MNTAKFIVFGFYQFFPLKNVNALQMALKQICLEQQVLGTVILAEEGINGTLAGTELGIRTVIQFLKQQEGLENLDCKIAMSDFIPFKKLKIQLKKEIVTLGVPHLNLKPQEKTGHYVKPQDWNALLQDPEIWLIDTRNHFEVEMGAFQGARDPETDKFGDFPRYVQEHLDPAKHKKIAMYCTGGIRCEKASAYLLEHNFETVYQLQGGILNYLEKIPAEESLWQGKCFVFDERTTV